MTKPIGTYYTLSGPSTGLYKDKGSKFLAFAYPVKTEPAIKNLLENIRKEYFDARHHCYAYRLGAEKKNVRASDDGEPSGTAGKPILGQIQSFDLTNVLVVVVRYFGGTLLGTGGLIQAYKTASADALAHASVIEQYVYVVYQLSFEYPHMNVAMKLIKDFGLESFDHDFQSNCSVKIRVRAGDEPEVLAKIALYREITCKKYD